MSEQTGCCDSPDGELKPLGVKELFEHIVGSIKKWKAAGYPLTPDSEYHRRLKICRACPKGQYKWYQCRHCKCIVYSKAKLATEDCPFGLWS